MIPDAITLCEHCGVELGAPHTLLTSDCILDHAEPHAEPHVERKHGLLCRRHFHGMSNTLTQLEELFALRGYVIQPGAGGDGRSGKTIDSPAPGRIGVMALTDHRPAAIGSMFRDASANDSSLFWRDDPDAVPNIPAVLESWLRLVDEEAETNMLPFQRATFAVDKRGCVAEAYEAVGWSIPFTVTVRLLRRQRHWIAQQLWVDDYLADLSDLHLALARGIGDSMWARPIGRCPNTVCGARLYNDMTGADVVTCSRCKSSWSGVHYLRLRLTFEQEKTTA